MYRFILFFSLLFCLSTGHALAGEEATLETRAAEFLEMCEAASPEHRNFINCSCGRDYILDYPNQLVAARQKKSDEFRDRAQTYLKRMIEEQGEAIGQELAPYCVLVTRMKNKEELTEEEKQQFISLHGSMKKRTGANAGAYCSSMARAERELVLPDPPLPNAKFFWRNATLHKPCKNLKDYAAHLLKDIPEAPADINEADIQMDYTRVMRSMNGHHRLTLVFTVATDLDEASIEELRQTVFQRGADRAIKLNLHHDWENETVLQALELEIQQGIETALQRQDTLHHIYGVKLKNVSWSD
ncbi:hypothetical protein [Emcibacter sp.]|uniref:hypothetical protein n=1 Tax=Emcibacter sp. TaxID=1979954 RepID=UPI002AA8085F|nr:hypothetical protein [Emcibacter sp.]